MATRTLKPSGHDGNERTSQFPFKTTGDLWDTDWRFITLFRYIIYIRTTWYYVFMLQVWFTSDQSKPTCAVTLLYLLVLTN